MSGAVALGLAGGDEEAGSAQFPHVLGDVVLGGAAGMFALHLGHRFLSEAGWDPATRVLRPPAEHRFLGRPLCTAPGCTATANGVCSQCRTRLERAGLALADARLLPPPSGRAWTRAGDGACRVEQCPRPWVNAEHPLCRSHLGHQQVLGIHDVAEFAALTDTRPLVSLGVCAVAACDRQLLRLPRGVLRHAPAAAAAIPPSENGARRGPLACHRAAGHPCRPGQPCWARPAGRGAGTVRPPATRRAGHQDP